MNEKPEALVIADELGALMLADELGVPYQCDFHAVCEKAAAKLRRQHAENERLTANRDELGLMVQQLAVSKALLEAKNKRLREVLMRLQYDFKGHIKRYPSEEEVDAALRREDV